MMLCRHCATPLEHTFLDLGFAPPSNAYLTPADLTQPEKTYPLKVKVCHHCWLVQTEDYAQADELFNADYAYFSSTSSTWLAHAAQYAARMITELGLTHESLVIEVASNDGYLLKNFVAAGIPCLGIEPTASTAAAAESLGVPVLREFFGQVLARRLAASGQQRQPGHRHSGGDALSGGRIHGPRHQRQRWAVSAWKHRLSAVDQHGR